MVLNEVLSNTYLIYVKTQNFHWNVVDREFYGLHKMLEEQYEALAEIVDTVAERIRMLGETAPGSMQEFLKHSTLKETTSPPPTKEFLKILVQDHEFMIQDLKTKIEQTTSDPGTQDLLVQNLRTHEKFAWMLKSSM